MEYTQLRIWKQTRKKLRLIYALTGDSIISVVDRLATEEVERLKRPELPVELDGLPSTEKQEGSQLRL